MSDELQITYQGASANLYVIIRNPSDKKVWDVANTAWASWSDGSIGDYDIAMTDRSGDFYTANFPTAIQIGTRVVAIFYLRAGSAPATTDSVLDVADLTWDGAGVSSGSSVSLDSRALTSLASIKRHLGISVTTHDTVLTELINIVSDKIEKYCNRRFKASDYVERLDGDREQFFSVKNYPIVYVNRVASGSEDAMTVKYDGSGIRANAQVYYDEEGQNGGVRLRSFSSAGAKTETNILFSSKASTNALVSQINSSVTDWSATELVNVPTAELRPLGGQEAKGRSVKLTYSDEQQDDDYYVDYSAGTLKFSDWEDFGWPSGTSRMPRGRRNVVIDYRGGYETIPDDITGVVNEMVSEAFGKRNTNTALASESIGGYSYSLHGPDAANMNIINRLISYRSVQVGGLAV